MLRGEKTKVELRVADYGNGIDDDTFKGHIFKQIEAPNLLDEDSWLPSGRGLILIAQMTDVFSVSHQGERNCFTVVVTLDERQSL